MGGFSPTNLSLEIPWVWNYCFSPRCCYNKEGSRNKSAHDQDTQRNRDKSEINTADSQRAGGRGVPGWSVTALPAGPRQGMFPQCTVGTCGCPQLVPDSRQPCTKPCPKRTAREGGRLASLQPSWPPLVNQAIVTKWFPSASGWRVSSPNSRLPWKLSVRLSLELNM